MHQCSLVRWLTLKMKLNFYFIYFIFFLVGGQGMTTDDNRLMFSYCRTLFYAHTHIYTHAYTQIQKNHKVIIGWFYSEFRLFANVKRLFCFFRYENIKPSSAHLNVLLKQKNYSFEIKAVNNFSKTIKDLLNNKNNNTHINIKSKTDCEFIKEHEGETSRYLK